MGLVPAGAWVSRPPVWEMVALCGGCSLVSRHHGRARAPDRVDLLHQGTLAGATLPRSRRRLAPTGMMLPSRVRGSSPGIVL